MMQVLDDLGRLPGVLGALVTTTDGIVVLSRLRPGMDEEAAAALVASLTTGTMNLLGECGGPRFERLVLKASRGKIVVFDLGHSYLVVIIDRELDLDHGLLEVKSAAKALRRLGCLTG